VDAVTPVRVESPGGGFVDGVVRTVSPGLDAQNRTGTVYVDLPDPGALRAGMFAQGRLALGRAQALLVPGDAVVGSSGIVPRAKRTGGTAGSWPIRHVNGISAIIRVGEDRYP